MFTDNCLLHRISDSTEDIQQDLNKVAEWADTWQLCSKTCARITLPTIHNYMLNSHILEVTNHTLVCMGIMYYSC